MPGDCSPSRSVVSKISTRLGSFVACHVSALGLVLRFSWSVCGYAAATHYSPRGGRRRRRRPDRVEPRRATVAQRKAPRQMAGRLSRRAERAQLLAALVLASHLVLEADHVLAVGRDDVVLVGAHLVGAVAAGDGVLALRSDAPAPALLAARARGGRRCGPCRGRGGRRRAAWRERPRRSRRRRTAVEGVVAATAAELVVVAPPVTVSLSARAPQPALPASPSTVPEPAAAGLRRQSTPERMTLPSRRRASRSPPRTARSPCALLRIARYLPSGAGGTVSCATEPDSRVEAAGSPCRRLRATAATASSAARSSSAARTVESGFTVTPG